MTLYSMYNVMTLYMYARIARFNIPGSGGLVLKLFLVFDVACGFGTSSLSPRGPVIRLR